MFNISNKRETESTVQSNKQLILLNVTNMNLKLRNIIINFFLVIISSITYLLDKINFFTRIYLR